MLLSIFFKAAIKRGAVSVREPWDETDEGGTVTFATVQTVSEFVATFNWWWLWFFTYF